MIIGTIFVLGRLVPLCGAMMDVFWLCRDGDAKNLILVVPVREGLSPGGRTGESDLFWSASGSDGSPVATDVGMNQSTTDQRTDGLAG